MIQVGPTWFNQDFNPISIVLRSNPGEPRGKLSCISGPKELPVPYLASLDPPSRFDNHIFCRKNKGRKEKKEFFLKEEDNMAPF